MGFNYKKGKDETDLSFIFRIGEAKSLGIIDKTWEELAEIFNSELRNNDKGFTESAYRKKYSVMKAAKNEIFSSTSDESEELLRLRIDLEKERVKVRDERNELKRIIREEARNESFSELLKRIIRETNVKPLEYDAAENVNIEMGNRDMLIPLFDLHYGLSVNNYFNQFDDDVFQKRFIKYIRYIKDIQLVNKCENAHVVLSEICSGIIHNNLRIENNQNVIEQFINVSSHITTFLLILSNYFKNIYVYVAPGNHGRIFQKKDDNAKGENIDNLVLPFLEAKLQNVDNIHCVYNTLDEGIVVFDVRNQKVVSVHGDLDTPENVVNHIVSMFGFKPNVVLQGHFHTNQFRTLNGDVYFIQSGCFSGADNHCIQFRLNNKPGQMVSILDDNGVHCLYPVILA